MAAPCFVWTPSFQVSKSLNFSAYCIKTAGLNLGTALLVPILHPPRASSHFCHNVSQCYSSRNFDSEQQMPIGNFLCTLAQSGDTWKCSTLYKFSQSIKCISLIFPMILFLSHYSSGNRNGSGIDRIPLFSSYSRKS